jgi:hypothetical protein
MHSVPGRWIAAAFVPAAIIALLFFFDPNVSSQLAQQPDKLPAYHYDFLLLGALWSGCCLEGPSHGRLYVHGLMHRRVTHKLHN